MGKTGPTAEVRDLVRKRAGGFCEFCALPLLRGAHFHHRQPRGIGGSKTHWVNRPSNLIYLHPACHARIESNREEAYRKGLLVKKPLHPETVPMQRWSGWVILHDDGRVSPVELPKEHALQQRQGR